jgi:hypothetical protein
VKDQADFRLKACECSSWGRRSLASLRMTQFNRRPNADPDLQRSKQPFKSLRYRQTTGATVMAHRISSPGRSPNHLVDLRLSMVDSWAGAKRRPLLSAVTDAVRRERCAQRVSPRRSRACAKGVTSCGQMIGSYAAIPEHMRL